MRKGWLERFEKHNVTITCLGENNEKYITLTVSIENEVTRINKNGVSGVTKNRSYMLQFIDSVRFIASSISNLVNNLLEGIHKIKCKYRHNKCETCGITYELYGCFLECTNYKDDLIE